MKENSVLKNGEVVEQEIIDRKISWKGVEGVDLFVCKFTEKIKKSMYRDGVLIKELVKEKEKYESMNKRKLLFFLVGKKIPEDSKNLTFSPFDFAYVNKGEKIDFDDLKMRRDDLKRIYDDLQENNLEKRDFFIIPRGVPFVFDGNGKMFPKKIVIEEKDDVNGDGKFEVNVDGVCLYTPTERECLESLGWNNRIYGDVYNEYGSNGLLDYLLDEEKMRQDKKINENFYGSFSNRMNMVDFLKVNKKIELK